MSKLLVVDDNPIYLRRLKELFADEGYEVETAESPDAAIELAETFHPDVLLVDRMLHNCLDGFDVAETLSKSSPGLKTIVVTGYPSDAAARKADESEIFAFFEKPFDPLELCDAVRRAATGQDE